MFPTEEEKTDPSLELPLDRATHQRPSPRGQPVPQTISLEELELEHPPESGSFDAGGSVSHVSKKSPMPPSPQPRGQKADISVIALLAIGLFVFGLFASLTFGAAWAFYALL